MNHRLISLIFSLLLVLPPAQSLAASDLQQGVDEITRQIAAAMKNQGTTTIAIVEFADLNGNVNQFGQLLAEKLITALFSHSPGQFNIVERRQLMRVVAEQELSVSGLVDKESIGKIASILGVDALVTGTISPFGNIVEINARCISVETAMVFAAAATTVPITEDVKASMAKSGSFSGMTQQQAPGSSTQATSPSISGSQAEGVFSGASFPQTWEGSYARDSTTKPMILLVEEYSAGFFSGKLFLPEDRNSIATIRGSVVTDFSDFVERSKWRYVDGFPSAAGTWIKFTTESSVQGGLITLKAVYYGLATQSGSMYGAAFHAATASEPWVSFNFGLK